MKKNLFENFTHKLAISFAVILVLSTAVVYEIIKNSPLPTQKSIAGVNDKASNPQKKQRNQSQEEYLKKVEEFKNKNL
jgi:hypothetical protein